MRCVLRVSGWLVVLLCLMLGCDKPIVIEEEEMDTFTFLRERMVTEQLRPVHRGITDPGVLRAMLKVKRHLFVPENLQNQAYEDSPLPIGFGQTISQPYIVALMTQLLKLQPTEKVLEIGTGSGYQAAVLAEFTPAVYTIEIVEPLAKKAVETLHSSGYSSVRVRSGDGYHGWQEEAPFDVIIVTCAPERIPEPLVGQLRDGGRMVIPVGATGGVQELLLLRKRGSELEQQQIIPVRFVPMTGKIKEFNG